jgi:hypothetical protein
MRGSVLVALLLCLVGAASPACDLPIAIDRKGRPIKVSHEEQVRSAFARSAYVVVGDVIAADDVVGTHSQKATILVKRSWKPSKREGDTLLVLTDLSNTCGARIAAGTQLLIYATGPEPIGVFVYERLLHTNSASLDIRLLDQIAAELPPNKPFQRTRSKQRASER